MNRAELQSSLDKAPMGRLQFVVVFICVLLTAIDGFDVLAISFASPGIASQWQLSKSSLGLLLAMELIGMSVGSLLLGSLADKIGRRKIILVCLSVMTLGMFASALAPGVELLMLFRVFTGIGVGGMLAATNALVAEYANSRYRSFCVVLMAAGYPIGASLGGAVVSDLLTQHSWPVVFIFGGTVTLLALVLSLLLLPESLAFLMHQNNPSSLSKMNAILVKMDKPTLTHLPSAATTHPSEVPTANVFKAPWRNVTLVLTLAYFAQIMTFYYIVKWLPKIVSEAGYTPSDAGSVLVWANVGGVVGAIVLGVLSSRIALRWLLMAAGLGGFFMLLLFGYSMAEMHETQNANTQALLFLSAVMFVTVFFVNAGVVGLYAAVAKEYSATIRASGTGVVIGIGRGGAALGPITAGLLMQADFSLVSTSVIMGSGAIAMAIAIWLLPRVSVLHRLT